MPVVYGLERVFVGVAGLDRKVPRPPLDHLGLGRMVVSETEAPNTLAITV